MTRAPLLAALLIALAAAPAAPDDDGDAGAPSPVDPLRSAQVERILSRAHDALVEWQRDDGSFSLPSRSRHSSSVKRAPVAVTALSALSLMAHGHLPDRVGDDKSRAVRDAIQWLVDRCVDEGPTSGYFTDGVDSVSKMHGQGYALLALTQAAGAWGSREVDRVELDAAIVRAVDLVERSQTLQGGWHYEPRRTPYHEGSITVCMIQALRAAKDAGYAVDPAVIERALEYMRKSQDEQSGAFRYQIGDPRTSWALTAAALSTLNALGQYDGEMLRDGHDALDRRDPWTGDGSREAFRWYGSFYAAQAYWVHPDRRRFERWWGVYVDACEQRQNSDGSFSPSEYGPVYATAMVSLSLAVPFGTMPLFQR